MTVREVLRAVLKHELPIDEVISRLTALGLDTPDMSVELPKLLERVPFQPD